MCNGRMWLQLKIMSSTTETMQESQTQLLQPHQQVPWALYPVQMEWMEVRMTSS